VSDAVDRTADRLAINELLATYSWALTDRDWSAWRAVFTDDAQLDYSTAGGPVSGVDEAVEWLGPTLAGFERTLSHGGNTVITFADDECATVRSIYTMTMKLAGDTPTFIQASGWYDDVVVRTSAGWKISRRVEQLAYVR
jgi:3-phenylpropionate/cinnamic acid dioxygenase small subunit